MKSSQSLSEFGTRPTREFHSPESVSDNCCCSTTSMIFKQYPWSLVRLRVVDVHSAGTLHFLPRGATIYLLVPSAHFTLENILTALGALPAYAMLLNVQILAYLQNS